MPDIPEGTKCEFYSTWPPSDTCGRTASRAYQVGYICFVTCDDPNHDHALYEVAKDALHSVTQGKGEPEVILFDASSNTWISPSTGN